MSETKTEPLRRMVSAKLSREESALLDRACGRLRITRTEAVQRGIRLIIKRQRQIEAMRPLGE